MVLLVWAVQVELVRMEKAVMEVLMVSGAVKV
jgi:hypothetical protein